MAHQYSTREVNEYERNGLTRDKVEEIHSRSLGPDGKVYEGEAGQNLLRKKREVQEYYERNQRR